MAKQRRIKVRGEPRSDIDPAVFLQVLLAIGEECGSAEDAERSTDAFDAAIEDRLAVRKERTRRGRGEAS
jgi:hypothetical protein